MTDRSGGRMKTKVKVANRDRLVRRAIMTALVLMALFATSLIGQQAPSQLTLEEAIGLAKANNPTFLSTQNDQSAANWQVREAYAQFLPSLRAGVGGTWQAAGVQRFGTVEFAQNTDWLYSGYSLNFGMTIDGNTIFGIPNARANKRATGARITAAEFNLESTVALQYMAVLRGLDGVDVAQRQLDRAQQNLQIVNTRVSTGAAAGTEGKQAEVDLGRAEVTLIQAERDLRTGATPSLRADGRHAGRGCPAPERVRGLPAGVRRRRSLGDCTGRASVAEFVPLTGERDSCGGEAVVHESVSAVGESVGFVPWAGSTGVE